MNISACLLIKHIFSFKKKLYEKRLSLKHIKHSLPDKEKTKGVIQNDSLVNSEKLIKVKEKDIAIFCPYIRVLVQHSF